MASRPPRINSRPRCGALPDDFDYRDAGCSLSPSCLRCPYPACRYDQPAGRVSIALQQRLASVTRLAHDPSYTRDNLATLLGVSRRQVFRYIRRISHADH